MLYFGIYETESYPYRHGVNVYGDTIKEIKNKYEEYVQENSGYIVNLYPMNNEANKELYGRVSGISITI